MSRSELLTRGTVWLALCGYAAGVCMWNLGRPRSAWHNRARSAWTAGCLLFLAHVVCAFTFYHHWSHADAYEATARRTASIVGFRSGAGLLLNYLFALAWTFDVTWWWSSPRTFEQRPRLYSRLLHGYLFFMVVNGAVIFAGSGLQWLGLVLTFIVAWSWWRRPAGLTE